jgi:glycosyltransferase involved in cell wall biosynthesis
MRGYTGELKNLMRELDLRDVEFTGMVSDEQVAQAYADADVFLSMSEHEGFFVPLIESMHFRLPILAYNSSVIPETLGGSGVMFTEKNFPMVAETIVELHENSPFRESILEAQTQRAAAFSLSSTTGIFDSALDQALQGDLPKL